MSSDISEDGTHPEIPDQQWTNPFAEGTWLHDLYDDRVRNNRDLIIVLDDYWGGRGTGKTISSLQLANGMDQTQEGLTREKCSLRPEEIRNAYTSQPPRSGLVFDEGEVGASNRDAMSKVNKALREIMSMGRVEQKYVVINAPIKSFIDKDLLKLADVWISIVRKGQALVFELRWETHSEQLLTPKKQWIEFEDVPTDHRLRDIYNALTREKRQLMDGDGEEFVPLDEHEQKLESARREARQEMRDQLLQDLWRHPARGEKPVSQGMLADVTGLDQSTISRIVNPGE